MAKMLVLIYGGVCYAAFFATFLYFVGFLSGLVVPKAIDHGQTGALGAAMAINVGLIALFGVQHTVMARPEFKSVWMKIIPKEIERSTYVLITSIVLGFLMWAWRPMPDPLWRIEGVGAYILWAVFFSGVGLVLLSSFVINHFHLFGLQQVAQFFKGKALTDPRYKENLLYKIVRHPLMLGFIIAMWSTPVMSAGHFLFAAGMTAYILIALHYEERDLAAAHGDTYRAYQSRVAMLIPFIRLPGPTSPDARNTERAGEGPAS